MTGNEVYTHELTKSMVRCYPDNEYYAILYLNRRKEAERAIGRYASMKYMNMLPHDLLLGKQFRSAVSAISGYLKRSISKTVDLYHCTNPNAFPLGINNGVVTLHDLIALRPEPWSSAGSQMFYRENIEKILSAARMILTVSDFTRNDAIERYPSISDKIFTTPLAANPVFRVTGIDRGYIRKFGVKDPEKPYLLSVGEIQPRKNVGGFVKAFRALPEKTRKEYQLIFVGKAKQEQAQQQFNEELAILRQENDVYHLENVPIDDLVRLYNTAHLFVYLSFFEGFGLPVVEAMSCGCPVLTSSTTSLGEVASNAALTVDPHNHDAVVAALHELLTAESLRARYREIGLLRAGEFSWEKTARLTMEGYKKAYTS
jgi:glycosyltransferase involved in cell wall biosynthesis